MEAVRVMWQPWNDKQVWAFHDLVGSYHKFIKNFAHIAKPLMTLMWHDAKFFWTPTYQTAFITLKEALTQTPILPYPDPSKPCIVYIDASGDACGAQLSQEYDGQGIACHLPLTLIHGNSMQMENP